MALGTLLLAEHTFVKPKGYFSKHEHAVRPRRSSHACMHMEFNHPSPEIDFLHLFLHRLISTQTQGDFLQQTTSGDPRRSVSVSHATSNTHSLAVDICFLLLAGQQFWPANDQPATATVFSLLSWKRLLQRVRLVICYFTRLIGGLR
jgi:hypothetical protein